MRNAPLILLLIVIGAAAVWWNITRSRALLNRWAEDSGCEILESHYRVFRKGPFFWTSSKGQTVYYVTIRDPQGYQRSGWARCGRRWWGRWSNETQARRENRLISTPGTRDEVGGSERGHPVRVLPRGVSDHL